MRAVLSWLPLPPNRGHPSGSTRRWLMVRLKQGPFAPLPPRLPMRACRRYQAALLFDLRRAAASTPLTYLHTHTHRHAQTPPLVMRCSPPACANACGPVPRRIQRSVWGWTPNCIGSSPDCRAPAAAMRAHGLRPEPMYLCMHAPTTYKLRSAHALPPMHDPMLTAVLL